MILGAWIRTPTLAARLCDLFRPNAKYVVIGHTHYPGVWRRGHITVINTGSYVLHFGALAVILDGESVEIRKIKKTKRRVCSRQTGCAISGNASRTIGGWRVALRRLGFVLVLNSDAVW